MSRRLTTCVVQCANTVTAPKFFIPSITRRRTFTTTGARSLNPLLNLSGLAFSKEAQYFSKERKIPREEYSSNLQLIRSSEVDPFAPAPGASPSVVAALRRAQRGESDMQTAYSLAISNLLAQLDVSRTEAKQAKDALHKLQVQHKSQESQALSIILAIVLASSVWIFYPDIIERFGANFDGVRQHLHNFDWQWLGNPPKHRSATTAPSSIAASTQNPHIHTLRVLTDDKVMVEVDLDQYNPVKLGAESSIWSRLFWAPSK